MTSLGLATVVSRRNLSLVRRLATTCAQHVGSDPITALVVDASGETPRAAEADLIRIVTPADLDLDEVEFARMAMLYTERELVASMKPQLITYLLERGSEVVAYLAPEVEVVGSIDPLVDAARDAGVALVARIPEPPARDGREPSEIDGLREGAFDAGSLAVGGAGRAFVGWWATSLQRECFEEPQNQRFLDQRWLDLVPGRFAYRVVDDPGAGVAAWNLADRLVTADGDGYRVDGRAVRWFHFAGFDPEQPDLLAPRLAAPRARLSRQPDLARLCAERAAWLRDASRADDRDYGFDRLPDGSIVDLRMRHLYRGALHAAEEHGDQRPPTPFGPDGPDRFVAWCNEPVVPRIRPVVSRYLAQLWSENPRLHETYPDLTGASAAGFLDVARVLLGDMIPTAVRPTEAEVERVRLDTRRARPAGPSEPGVNLVGYLDAVLGIGEAARLVGGALVHAGVPHRAVTYAGSRSERNAAYRARDSDGTHDLNLVCVNPDLLAGAARELGPEFFAGRHTIGLWFWEVDRFTPAFEDAFVLVDEIWVASDYMRDLLAPASPKPVIKVPLPVPLPPEQPAASRADLGLPDDRFLFLFAYDFLSEARRKNPIGVIDAYTRAFGPDDGTCLVLKSINGSQQPRELERVLMAARGRDDIVVVDRYLPLDHHVALAALCDAYVSLHRAEGFGLTMAEAMALGKPVVATRFSGNLDFMDDDTAYLVDTTIVDVGEGVGVYPPDARWADPKVDEAVRLMRRIVEHRDQAAEVGARAAARIRTEYSVDAVAPRLVELLEAARARHGRGPATWRNFFTRGWRLAPTPVRRYYEYDWLPDGTPVDLTMQRTFDTWLQVARYGRAGAPPNPDVPGGSAATIAWLNEPVAPPDGPMVSRYLLQYWRDRPELRARFPGIDAGLDSYLFGEFFEGGDAVPADPRDPAPYLEWVRDHWRDDTDIPYRLVPPPVDELERQAGAREQPTPPSRFRRIVRRPGA